MKKRIATILTLGALTFGLTACGEVGGVFNPAPSATARPATPATPVPPVRTPVPGQPAPGNPAPPPGNPGPGNPPAPAVPTAHPGGFETFSYTPGGESFGKWATDVIAPDNRSDCGRVWQATNLKNTAWTVVFCGWKVSNPTPKLQWPHPMQLTVTGNGTVEFDLYRDHGAVQQLRERGDPNAATDPYDVANAQRSPLGLAWQVQGFQGQACINDKCQALDGGGVYQIGFPKDWRGHHKVRLTVNNGQLQFWQGEKVTSTDTWPAQ